jgi:LPS-assembly protein
MPVLGQAECRKMQPCMDSCMESNFDDWVESCEPDNLCGGYYCEEPPPFPNASDSFLAKQPITVTASHAEFNQEGASLLRGQVHLIQGNRQVKADSAKVCRDPKTNKIDTIQASGNVRILEPGFRLEGSNALISLPTDIKTLSNAQYRIYSRHARGCAKSMTAFSNTRLFLQDASYTTCKPGNNNWELRAKLVNLNRITGKGVARGGMMYLRGFPVFYFPSVTFPIDDRRETGFLFPAIGQSRKSGFELATPFYWNLAPNYDATLTPRLLSKRGIDMQGQFRYLLPIGQGELLGGYLPNDDAYRNFRNEKRLFPEYPANDPRTRAILKGNNSRSAFFAKHTSQFNQNWTGLVNYNVVGDDNYFMDLGTNLYAAGNTQLLQQAELKYQDYNWRVFSRVQAYQTLYPYYGPLNSEVYQRLPQIAFANECYDLPYGFEWEVQGEVANFAHRRNPFTSERVTTGGRYFVRPGLAYSYRRPWGFFRPRLQIDMLTYSLNRSNADLLQLAAWQNSQIGQDPRAWQNQARNPKRILPIIDIDTGLIFERNTQVCDCPYIQTLEPRAYYLYVPYQNQNTFPNFDSSYPGFDYNLLYRDNRFNGFDRLGDANQITLGVTTRFLRAQGGEEQLSLTAGQIYYFQPPRVLLGTTLLNPNFNPALNPVSNPTLNPFFLDEALPFRNRYVSPLVGLGRYRCADEWFAIASVEWSVYRKSLYKSAFWVQYRPSELTVMNVGYQYLQRNPVVNFPRNQLSQKLGQIDVSAAYELTHEFRVLGQYNYDLQNNRCNTALIGLEHQGCCTAFRVSFISYLLPNAGHREYNSGIFFQFVFKGFSSVGHRELGGVISRTIPGYEWHGDKF